MKSLLAHRALFGERSGAHGCLACSGDMGMWRSFPAIEMDLPDSEPAGVKWNPFFRGWFHQGNYYFSRTEPDANARRSGMVRTQVLRVGGQDVGEFSDLLPLFAELTRNWSVEESSTPWSVELQYLNLASVNELVNPLLSDVAERLAHMGGHTIVIMGEEALRDLIVALWQRLPFQIRQSLTFGFSFSPADLEHRSLHLACFPKSLQSTWKGYSNSAPAISFNNTTSVAGAYLLGLPIGNAITVFAQESGLPAPSLHELGTYERVAKDWANSSNLDFEGWASLVLGLISLAPRSDQAVEFKRVSVEQAAWHIRPHVADDILCLRGFKLSALGEAIRPVPEAISKWLWESITAQVQSSELVEILSKYRTTAIEDWKNWVLEGLQTGFRNAPEIASKALWRIWLADDGIFDELPPTKISPPDSEKYWAIHVPPKLSVKLGEKVLNWSCRAQWWKLHATVAVSFLSWNDAIRRQINADGGKGGIEPVRIICRIGNPSMVVQYAVEGNDSRIHECAIEICAANPVVFSTFDPHQEGWLSLLAHTIKRRKDILAHTPNSSVMLFSILDFLLEGGSVSPIILEAFIAAKLGDLTDYRQRISVWSKLPPNLCGYFQRATALGWFAAYFHSGGKISPPESDVRAFLFGMELRDQRFRPTTPNLINSGLMLFNAFPEVPEAIFEEWLKAVTLNSTTMSSTECNQVVQIILNRKWESAARFIEQESNLGRSDLNLIWRSYWRNLSRSKKLFWQMEYFLKTNTKQSGTQIQSYRSSMASSQSSEHAKALFLTALGLEFKAVVAHLSEVQEKTIDDVVYAVGFFAEGNEKYVVAVAQTGAGNVEAATLTERAIKQFSPRHVFFVGIAGGLKDELNLGDVVVAEKVYAYESGKAEKNFKTRPKAPWTGFASIQRAHATSRNAEWVKRIKFPSERIPNSYVKPIAAGEKVIDSHYSEAFGLIKQSYGDAYAVAMEEFGFYYALHLNPGVEGLVIRGISDFAQNKSTVEKQKSQEIAASNASAFAFEMLAGFCAAGKENPGDTLDYRHL